LQGKVATLISCGGLSFHW